MQFNSRDSVFSAMVNRTSDILTILHVDGQIRFVNAAIETLLGFTSEDLIGTNCFNYIHPMTSALTTNGQPLSLSKEGPALPTFIVTDIKMGRGDTCLFREIIPRFRWARAISRLDLSHNP